MPRVFNTDRAGVKGEVKGQIRADHLKKNMRLFKHIKISVLAGAGSSLEHPMKLRAIRTGLDMKSAQPLVLNTRKQVLVRLTLRVDKFHIESSIGLWCNSVPYNPNFGIVVIFL